MLLSWGVGWVLETSDSEYEVPVQGRRWLQVSTSTSILCDDDGWYGGLTRVTKMRKFKNSIDWLMIRRRSSVRSSSVYSHHHLLLLPFFSFNNNTRGADIPKCQSAYVISMTEIEEWLKQELTQKDRNIFNKERIIVLGREKNEHSIKPGCFHLIQNASFSCHQP